MKQISAEQLKQEMAQVSDIIVVNVLPEEHYQNCHIKNSVNIPLATLKSVAESWPKDANLVVYCAHSECNASAKAYNYLTEQGFTNVRAYEGGIKEWHEKGYPVGGACAA